MLEHRLGEDEGADEREDRRRAEGTDRIGGGNDPEHDDDPDAEQTTDGNRHRFGDPEDDDAEKDGGEHVPLIREVEGRSAKTMAIAGARMKPDVIRARSNLSSRGELLLTEAREGLAAQQARRAHRSWGVDGPPSPRACEISTVIGPFIAFEPA